MTSIDELVRDEARAGVDAALKPYLRRLASPECLTYTVKEAAAVVGCSPKKIELWLADGLLPRVPHYGYVAIPRVAVEAFIHGADPHEACRRAADVAVSRLYAVNDELESKAG